MSEVEHASVQKKFFKNVARKSTSKQPQIWKQSEKFQIRDITQDTIMEPTDSTAVYQETLDNLKALNGDSQLDKPIGENGDVCDSSLKIVNTESVLDNGLLDRNPTEDSNLNEDTHVSTDEEDNLLNLSDTESQEKTDITENNSKDSKNLHPLAIGVKVRNSVRDIMSKLVQDCSPEVNKILAKPKNEDTSKENSPKTIKADTDNKTENRNSANKMIKENLFEIMSAESESDDMILDGNTVKSQIVNEEMGEDTNISSVSMETTTQSEINTQDNTVSSLSMLEPTSVSSNSVDDFDSAKISDFENSVSASNSCSVDCFDKVSDISDPTNNENSKSERVQDSGENSDSAKLDESQCKTVSDVIDIKRSVMKESANLGDFQISQVTVDSDKGDQIQNMETDKVDSFYNHDKIKNVDKSDKLKKSGDNSRDNSDDTDNLNTMENLKKMNDSEKNENQNKVENSFGSQEKAIISNQINNPDIVHVNDSKSAEHSNKPKTFNENISGNIQNNLDPIEPIDDNTNVDKNKDDNESDNESSQIPKLNTVSDDDILDLNENSVSPDLLFENGKKGIACDVIDKFSDKAIKEKGYGLKPEFDAKDSETSVIKPSSSVGAFQFSVDDDDNSNSNLLGKIDIDQICDTLLFDEPKPDVSVEEAGEVKSKAAEDSSKKDSEEPSLSSLFNGTGCKDKATSNGDIVEEKKSTYGTIGNKEEEHNLEKSATKFTEFENMEIDSTTDDKAKIKDGDIEMANKGKLDSEVESKSEVDTKIDLKYENLDIKSDSDIKFKSDSKNNDIKDEKPEKIESMDIDDGSLTSSSQSKSSTSSESSKSDNSESSKSDSSENSSDSVQEKTKERKRSGESPNTESQAPPKRSRLDIMIGKLGSQIGISPESVPDPIDCDTVSESEEESKEESDEVKSEDEDVKSASATEDDEVKTIYEEVKKPTENKEAAEEKNDIENKEVVEEKKKVENPAEYSATTISDEDEDEDDDVKCIGEEPKKSAAPLSVEEDKEITNHKEFDLNEVIKKNVLQLIKTYRDETISALQNKVAYLTKTCEKWKNTARDLQKQVVDVTIVQQRLDKRKAATAALKSITSRTIGCQVDTTRLQGAGEIKSPPKMTTGNYTSFTVGQIPSNTPAKNMVSMIKQQQRPTPTPTSPVVSNMSQLLSATAESRNTNINTNKPTASSVRNLLETTGRSSSTNTGNSSTISGAKTNTKSVSYSGKVIDLTADEENTKKLNNSQAKTPIMVPVSNIPPVGQTQILRPVTPGSLPPGSSILLSGPSGTQIVNQSQFNRMGGALQVVTVSAGNQIRPGQFLTVVPSTGGNLRPQLVSVTTPIPSVSASTTLINSKPVAQTTTNTAVQPAKPMNIQPQAKHPAPLPPQPVNKTPNGAVKGLVPPKPDLKISRVSQGIVLSWTITQNLSLYSEIASYQLFAYQEGSTPPNSNLWKKVGDVKALPLPMACTLTQFQEGNKYHFAVRAIDVYQRISDFSEPSSIHLFPKS